MPDDASTGLDQIESAAKIVYSAMSPTPQYCWPLLSERLGCEIWVKHENHTPLGAFKVRGGLVYFDHIARSKNAPAGVIAATRGNHGQSVAFGASRYGMSCTIVVPRGNSREKNAAMRALGATLIEHGDDFQAAKEFAESLAPEKSLHMVPSFHPLLIAGVATYSMELLRAAPPLDVVYVPIGLGSGICGMIAARDALGLATDIVGVVSSHATAYADSWKAGYPVDSPVSTELADGMACRTPVPEALQLIQSGVVDIVQVSDSDIARAMRTLFESTHNICEGAGAASYAAAELQRERNRNRKIGVVISGGNIDRDVYSSVISASNGQDEWSR